MGADMASHHDVLERRHFREQADVLKRARNAGLGHFVNGRGPVGFAGQFETAAVGCVEAGEDIEEGGLAGAIGADQAIDLAALDGDAHLAQGLQAAEALGNAGNFEYGVCHVHSYFTFCNDLPWSGEGHRPRGRDSMMVIMASAISNWRRIDASSRPSVMVCRGPAT